MVCTVVASNVGDLDQNPSGRNNLMTPAERFLEEAVQCERMSKSSSTNKHAWLRMAERWRRCAELENKLENKSASDRKGASDPTEQPSDRIERRSRRTRFAKAPIN